MARVAPDMGREAKDPPATDCSTRTRPANLARRVFAFWADVRLALVAAWPQLLRLRMFKPPPTASSAPRSGRLHFSFLLSTLSFTPRALLHFSFLLSAFSFTSLVLYLSWLPDPAMVRVGWLPGGVARWADGNATLRTAVPFVLLAACLGAWLAIRRSPWRCWAIAAGGLLGLLFLAELGQLFLPARTFDWRDIAWGVAGSALGFAAVGAVRLVRWGTSKIGRSVSNVEGRR